MQVFIPYPSLTKTAKILDYKRLGKQRVESFQILNAIEQRSSKDIFNGGKLKGWVNHPCTIMWEKYPRFLVDYSIVLCLEWKERGYKDTMLERFEALSDKYPLLVVPAWWGDQELHLSHRSRLLQKDFNYYSQHFSADTPLTLDYIWKI